MPRKAREITNNKIYHIMIQGINKEYIFDNNKYKDYYLKLLRKKLSNYNSILIAYCIMDNHAHFLVYSGGENEISRLFQRINGAYSNYYNKVKNRVGYVFRDRFLSQEIYDNVQLINCIKYIHNNPVKAHMVNHAYEYYYSSYKDYKYKISSFIDFNIISIILKEIQNEDYVFNDDNYDSNMFIDICDFEKEEFYKEYLPKLNIDELKKNRKLLKEVIVKCIIQMKVPVKELAEIFKIPSKTIYCWAKNEKKNSSFF